MQNLQLTEQDQIAKSLLMENPDDELQKMFTVQGWVQYIEFDASKVDDLDMEKTIKKKIKKKGAKLSKGYICFRPDGYFIAKDEEDTSAGTNIEYGDIECLNLMGKTTYYFKTKKYAYSFFFKKFNPDDCAKWYEHINKCRENIGEKNNEIKIFDIAPNVTALKWNFQTILYRFNYKEIIGDKKDIIYEEKDKYLWIDAFGDN